MTLLLRSERQVILWARKKIVFTIVEGPSDEEALGVLLQRIYDRNAAFVHIMHRDITTDRGVKPEKFRMLALQRMLLRLVPFILLPASPPALWKT